MNETDKLQRRIVVVEQELVALRKQLLQAMHGVANATFHAVAAEAVAISAITGAEINDAMIEKLVPGTGDAKTQAVQAIRQLAGAMAANFPNWPASRPEK